MEDNERVLSLPIQMGSKGSLMSKHHNFEVGEGIDTVQALPLTAPWTCGPGQPSPGPLLNDVLCGGVHF